MFSLAPVQERQSSGTCIGHGTLQGQNDDLLATTEPQDGHVAHQEGNATTNDHHMDPQESMPHEANGQGRQCTTYVTKATTII